MTRSGGVTRTARDRLRVASLKPVSVPARGGRPWPREQQKTSYNHAWTPPRRSWAGCSRSDEAYPAEWNQGGAPWDLASVNVAGQQGTAARSRLKEAVGSGDARDRPLCERQITHSWGVRGHTTHDRANRIDHGFASPSVLVQLVDRCDGLPVMNPRRHPRPPPTRRPPLPPRRTARPLRARLRLLPRSPRPRRRPAPPRRPTARPATTRATTKRSTTTSPPRSAACPRRSWRAAAGTASRSKSATTPAPTSRASTSASSPSPSRASRRTSPPITWPCSGRTPPAARGTTSRSTRTTKRRATSARPTSRRTIRSRSRSA